MNEQQRHEMVLEKTHSSGAEEWHCPTCGRRMLVNWQPQFKKIILETGDDYALHSASKSLLPTRAVSPIGTIPQVGPEALLEEEQRLAPWLNGLEDIDLDNL